MFGKWSSIKSALLLIFFCYPAASAIGATDSSAENSQNRLSQQRATYIKATQALAKGDRRSYDVSLDTLSDYPLLPYLDYADLSTRLSGASGDELDRFFANYENTPPATRLRHRWLTHLAARKRWSEFIQYYRPDIQTTDLRCHYAYAQYHEGDRPLAVKLGRELWTVGKSQQKSCDPLFKLMINDGHIDDTTAWRRYVAAVLNQNYSLANYVTRFFRHDETKSRAQLYLQVAQNPRLIAQYNKFTDHTPQESQILSQGLTQLARIDSRLALNAWNRYHQSHQFELKDEKEITSTLIKSLYIQGHQQSAEGYFAQVQDLVTGDLLEWRLRELVKDANWGGIITWIGQLNEEHRANSRLKYWHARALELHGDQSPEQRQTLYNELSGERSFYGFLASEWLKTPYQMQNEPVDITQTELSQLAETPAFQRIRELYHHQELGWARREWNGHFSGKEPSAWITGAKLAEQWGWHNQAIMSMIRANYWNDIDTRFPIPYAEDFLSQAKATSIPVNLLLALSRQESAFNEKVTSPAGAKGLMQLMPGTARETARKHNIRYSGVKDLEEADKNILIGSRYYKQMLERFNNNRILATAAYNAGPSRVRTWRNRSDGKLPFDAWIEVIPFRETRNYVQNVLAFSIIYAHHLDLQVGILSPEEKNTLL